MHVRSTLPGHSRPPPRPRTHVEHNMRKLCFTCPVCSCPCCLSPGPASGTDLASCLPSPQQQRHVENNLNNCGFACGPRNFYILRMPNWPPGRSRLPPGPSRATPVHFRLPFSADFTCNTNCSNYTCKM